MTALLWAGAASKTLKVKVMCPHGNSLRLNLKVPGFACAQSGRVHEHMGMPVEISESTPGVMVAADGSEISLPSPLLCQHHRMDEGRTREGRRF